MTEQRQSVRSAYDEMADVYAAESAAAPPETELLSEIAERVPTGGRILDAGCGDGTAVAARLADEYDVVGLDVSGEQVRLARDGVPAAFVQGDMTRLPFRANRFDAASAFHSIIHVPTDEHGAVFAEFARVLAPGGSLLFSTGEEAWEGENPDWLDSGVEMQWSFPSLSTTRDLLSDAGFEIVDRWEIPELLADEEDAGTWPFLLATLERQR